MFNGKNAATNCFNNPYYRAWLSGMVENWARNYELDGIMWGSERQGAFGNMIGSNEDRAGLDKATCFCEHCQARAKEAGINFDRVKEGFAATDKFMKATQSKQRPVDGYYVEMWRLMLRYPELLAWEMLWTDSLRDTYKLIYAKIKEVNPKLMVGWHIWHNNSMSPIYRSRARPAGHRADVGLPEDCDVPQLRRRASGEPHRHQYTGACLQMSQDRSCWTSSTVSSTMRMKSLWRRSL